jgi:hypothetical protein
MEKHTETQVEEQPSNHDKREMEEEGFEEVIYGQNRRKQRQQVIIGTSRNSEITAKRKKHQYILVG